MAKINDKQNIEWNKQNNDLKVIKKNYLRNVQLLSENWNLKLQEIKDIIQKFEQVEIFQKTNLK